jgi:hypothetical protein
MSHQGLVPVVFWVLVLDRWDGYVYDHRLTFGQRVTEEVVSQWCKSQYGCVPAHVKMGDGTGYGATIKLP